MSRSRDVADSYVEPIYVTGEGDGVRIQRQSLARHYFSGGGQLNTTATADIGYYLGSPYTFPDVVQYLQFTTTSETSRLFIHGEYRMTTTGGTTGYYCEGQLYYKNAAWAGNSDRNITTGWTLLSRDHGYSSIGYPQYVSFPMFSRIITANPNSIYTFKGRAVGGSGNTIRTMELIVEEI